MAIALAGAIDVAHANASQLPAGFTDSVVFSGLTEPSAIQFSPDGRVFVAEKSGIIKVFDSLSDTTPTVFADLSTQVDNYWDRGLLGLALDPNFPASPYVYVHYTRDALIGGTAPRFGTPGTLSDPCPTPPGPLTDGCVVSGRLSRLQANGDVMTGTEKVLIDDWCQQFPSHSVGAIASAPTARSIRAAATAPAGRSPTGARPASRRTRAATLRQGLAPPFRHRARKGARSGARTF